MRSPPSSTSTPECPTCTRARYDQIKEQLRLTIETIKERQEGELINNADYGLLANVAPRQTITTLTGPPTPDDLDELITKVWKEPAFFLAHPLAIAAFGRECTRRGVPPPTVNLFGSPFLTWRGIPLIPSDKVPVEDGKTKILLIRTGEKRQGVVGLFQPGLAGEQSPGCRSASWGSTGTRSPPTSSRSTARSPSSPTTRWRCSTA